MWNCWIEELREVGGLWQQYSVYHVVTHLCTNNCTLAEWCRIVFAMESTVVWQLLNSAVQCVTFSLVNVLAWSCRCVYSLEIVRCLSSRLETRTKELNRYFSWYVGQHSSNMKMMIGISLHNALPSTVENLWGGMHVRTRKVVNYVCGGQSQRKPWWWFTLVLTCKLFTIYGYRGERLIESSSSWFPPKYPSG